jgi:hypothetical protein
MTIELVCVDPQRIHAIWPRVAHLIHGAVKRTNLSHTLDIERDVLAGNGLLWLAWDGRAVKAAATTALINTDAEKACIITACGGDDRRQWLPLLANIERYARDEGCISIRIHGRKGWARVLDGYRIQHVILRKDL